MNKCECLLYYRVILSLVNMLLTLVCDILVDVKLDIIIRRCRRYSYCSEAVDV